MEFLLSDKVIAECSRVQKETQYLTDLKKREVDCSLARKLENLEFFYTELLTQKDDLSAEAKELSPFENRIQQTKVSLEYPRDVSLKCLEIRKDRTGEDLCKDIVENELMKEKRLIESIQIFFEELLNEVKEQMRKYRSTIYRLKQNLANKEIALTIEKHNSELKPTDLCLTYGQPKNSQLRSPGLPENFKVQDWESDAEQLLNTAKAEIKDGRKLRYRADELLNVKTKELQDEHDRCNDIFYKRIAQYKDAKSFLEERLSKTNEQIFKMKQSMKELKNSIIEKEPNMNVAKIRMQNRVNQAQVELHGDEVEMRLKEEIRGLASILDSLKQKYSLAEETLLALNRLKDYLEREVQVKTNSVKLDEVLCLTLRSSVHYHAY